MTRSSVIVVIVVAFIAGFFTNLFYNRWNPPYPTGFKEAGNLPPNEPRSFSVRLAPAKPEPDQPEIPLISARDVEKLRSLTGSQVRVRGRVFRVGHSAKSNTYFVNFGPSREALTAVIFASALELFENNKLPPRIFAGREVEVQGEIKNHPQYGLELILESPTQIKLLD